MGAVAYKALSSSSSSDSSSYSNSSYSSNSSSTGYEIRSKTKYYKKITTDGKYRKIYIRCNDGVYNYVEESYDYYNSHTKHYFQANAGAVRFPKKFDTFDESAKELCARHI